MDKLWTGRFSKQLDEGANDFNSSIRFDSRMFREDIEGSVAHAAMLARQGIISNADSQIIVTVLGEILSDIDSGALDIDMQCEDIHSFVEGELTKRIGNVGKRLHTARSRNDQVALDLRMNLKKEAEQIDALLREMIASVADKAEQYYDAIMPGYTHTQRAQPITFGHHLMAYAAMLLRDLDRLNDCLKRINVSPIGSCALAGTTYPTDRHYEAELLGFDAVCENSMDGVSDRDYVIELSSVIAMIMMHLSRFSEEIILWCSWEYKFLELDDGYSTGSSIMPQKKNPDIAELIRGKTGRAYGNLVALLTVMKGIPLAYNKDMQEDKEAIFDSVDTVKQCLAMFAPMLATAKVLTENMKSAAAKGFINATDCADYLTKKGVPFRTAYKSVGEIVAYCIRENKTLEDMSLEEYLSFSDIFDNGVYSAIDMSECVKKRISYGATSPESVLNQVKLTREKINK